MKRIILERLQKNAVIRSTRWCFRCGGTGKLGDEGCYYCQGSGVIDEQLLTILKGGVFVNCPNCGQPMIEISPGIFVCPNKSKCGTIVKK